MSGLLLGFDVARICWRLDKHLVHGAQRRCYGDREVPRDWPTNYVATWSTNNCLGSRRIGEFIHEITNTKGIKK